MFWREIEKEKRTGFNFAFKHDGFGGLWSSD